MKKKNGGKSNFLYTYILEIRPETVITIQEQNAGVIIDSFTKMSSLYLIVVKHPRLNVRNC